MQESKKNGLNGTTQGQISLKDSIKTRLIAVMILVAAIPLLIAVSVSYGTSTSKARTDAIDILDSDADLVESDFAKIVEKNVLGLQTLAASPTTQDYLKLRGFAGLSVSDEEMLAQMDLLNDNIGDGNKSCILSLPSGQQLLRTDRKNPSDISDREYFQKCTANLQVTVSEIVVSKGAGNRICIVIVPIVNDNGELIGTLQRSFDLNVLHEFLASHISEGYIVDFNGIVAADAQVELTPDDEDIDKTYLPFILGSETSGVYEDRSEGKLKYIAYVKEPITNYTVCVVANEDEVMAPAIRSAMIVVIIGVVLILLSILISFMMARSFTEPVKAVGESLGALADGRFVRVQKFDGRKDEFGEISRATNSVIATLDDIVANIKESATNVGYSSEELSDMADQISKTAEDVANAVQEIATGATQQAEEIQRATENVERIGDAVGEVQHSTNELSDLAGKMKEASEVSGKSLSSLQDSSEQMTVQIDEISRTIQATQDAVTNINEKVEGITSIATQTNLLSLNASIEAARAGEAGRGFAVVAEEIGKLADDSKQMADEIRKEMEVLLAQSQAAVGAAEDVKNGNNDQQIALGETLEAVNGMLGDIDSTVSGVKLIESGAETCDSAKNSVVDTMSALSAISEENAASSEETGASMEELSATVTTLANSANALRKIAEKLNEDMQFFKA